MISVIHVMELANTEKISKPDPKSVAMSNRGLTILKVGVNICWLRLFPS